MIRGLSTLIALKSEKIILTSINQMLTVLYYHTVPAYNVLANCIHVALNVHVPVCVRVCVCACAPVITLFLFFLNVRVH